MKLFNKYYFWGFFVLLLMLVIFLVVTTFAYSQRQTDDLSQKLDRITYDLLGFIEFEDQRFGVEADQQSSYQRFLQSQVIPMASEQAVYFYIWNPQQKQLVFDIDSSLPFISKSADRDAVKVQLAEQVISGSQLANAGDSPVGRSKKLALMGGDEYLLSNQTFQFSGGANGELINYHYIAAVSTSRIKAEASQLFVSNAQILLLIMLLGSIVLIIAVRFFKRESKSNSTIELQSALKH